MILTCNDQFVVTQLYFSPKMPQMLNCNDKTEGITLSSDLFTAKTDEKSTGSVRAIEPVLKQDGVYFYEVKILSDTSMQIGWATKKCFLDSISPDHVNRIGRNQESIGFDGINNVIYNIGGYSNGEKSKWKSGDVLGCLINVPEKTFLFFLNGKKFGMSYIRSGRLEAFNVQFSTFPYYPAASLSANSKAYFNFGQQPFQFPVKDIVFSDFYGYRFNQYFQRLEQNDWNKDIVLSSDAFSVRHNSSVQTDKFQTLKASLSVKSGVYFYEVHLLSDGSMKIGWILNGRYSSSSIKCTVGESSDNLFAMFNSIGFDGYRKLIWHSSKQFDIDGSCWKTGDVLGCLMNIEQKNFVFYLNGKEYDVIKLGIAIDSFNFQSYYPSLSLTAGQQVYCNFGQEPFRFAPKGFEFKDFYGNQFK